MAAEAPRLLAGRPIAALLLAGVMAAIAAISASAAFANAYARSAPFAAASLWPANGFAAGHAASALIQSANAGGQGTSGVIVPAQVRPLAESAILAEPGAVFGLRNLALAHAASGEGERATRLMRLAVRLSARDTAANMWLVEDYLRRGDLARATALIDTTLRTDRAAGAVLLPGLANMLDLPGAEPVLLDMLAGDPPWGHDFWAATGQVPDVLDAAASLRLALHRRGALMAPGHDARLIEQLVAAQKFGSAFTLYGEARRAALYPPIDWRLAGSQGLAVSHEPGGGLAISARGGSGGVAAQRLVALPRGRYALRVTGDAPSEALTARLACAHLQGERTFSVTLRPGEGFDQPTACRFTWLSLDLLPSEADRTLEIEAVALARIGGS